jgi:hypothetical protein
MASEPGLIGVGKAQSANTSNDRDWILREVGKGLPNSQIRLAAAIENQAFFDLDSRRYAPRREAETEFDFAGRPQRESGLTQQAIDRLCEHQYSPGPHRSLTGDKEGLALSLLEQVWETNDIDSVMQESECLSTLNDVAAIQVEPTNDPDKPIDLKLWGGDEIEVFVDPADPRKPFAVVTIDRYNQRTRYRVWFDDLVHTYETDQYRYDKTAGARVASPVDRGEPNTCGVIPFAFVHYRPAVRQFWNPGIGSYLRRAELRINARLSELDELIAKYARPIGVFKNVSPMYSPDIGPARFLRLPRAGGGYTGEGYAGDGEPSAEYLQASLAIGEIWEDLKQYVKQVASSINLPFNALELDYMDAPSGISLIIRMAPLITRAKRRRPIFKAAETNLAKTILAVAGNHYGHPELVASAKTLRLVLAWGEPRIPVPGPDRDTSAEWEIQMGMKSRLSEAMERYGFPTRDQALAHFAQVAEDEAELNEMTAEATAEEEAETAGLGEEMPEGEQEEQPEADLYEEGEPNES